jgi:hypothetical protein
MTSLSFAGMAFTTKQTILIRKLGVFMKISITYMRPGVASETKVSSREDLTKLREESMNFFY